MSSVYGQHVYTVGKGGGTNVLIDKYSVHVQAISF